jgi:hypothetical protein
MFNINLYTRDSNNTQRALITQIKRSNTKRFYYFQRAHKFRRCCKAKNLENDSSEVSKQEGGPRE